MSGAKHWEQDKEATVYIGNLDERVTDSLVWELMLQAGRIVNVHLPKDRVTQSHQGYGFVEFISEEDAEYAARIMNQIRLFGKPIRVNKASADKQKSAEVGAELFVGNLDPMVSEQILFDTFSRFGTLLSAPKVARDDAGLSKGYGFVSFSNFESSDDAIANLHGQYLANKEVSVQYAYKKDGKGERHGDHAERMLAAQAREHNVELPAQSLHTSSTHNNPGAVPTLISESDSRAMMTGGNNYLIGKSVSNPSTVSGTPKVPRLNTYVQSLPPPPSGLPARPPPSQVGYGGPPSGFLPPTFQNNSYSPNADPSSSVGATVFPATQLQQNYNRNR